MSVRHFHYGPQQSKYEIANQGSPHQFLSELWTRVASSVDTGLQHAVSHILTVSLEIMISCLGSCTSHLILIVFLTLIWSFGQEHWCVWTVIWHDEMIEHE